MKRKISAILAADIVKYSKLVGEDEEETVGRLADYRALFEETTARRNGRIVNVVGDAVLAEFASSVDAVRCALDVQEAVRSRNLAYPESREMNVRIGVTLADVMDENGELFGDGVNIAARLEGLAPPGGICVSEMVREQVGERFAVKFEDMGRRRVKNIAKPVRAYLIPPGADGARKGRAAWRPRVFPRAWLLATAVGALVILAGVVTAALRFYPQGEKAPVVSPGTGGGTPTAAAAHAVRFDEAKLRALALSQGIPLPRQIKILLPAPNVPTAWADYLGGWGGDKRWNGAGRQALLIIESIDETGTALGIYGQSQPLVTTANNPPPARFFSFVGTMSDKGMNFHWGQASYMFRLMPDGLLWGRWETGNEQRRFELTITLERIE